MTTPGSDLMAIWSDLPSNGCSTVAAPWHEMVRALCQQLPACVGAIKVRIGVLVGVVVMVQHGHRMCGGGCKLPAMLPVAV